MNNETFRWGFTPPHMDHIPHMKEEATRALSIELVKLLDTGDRFTVKLIKEEPAPDRLNYQMELGRYGALPDRPLFMYSLEIGKVYERVIEIPVWAYTEPSPEPLPDYKIALTDSRLLADELATRFFSKAKYHLRYWTAAKVDADIAAWRD